MKRRDLCVRTFRLAVSIIHLCKRLREPTREVSAELTRQLLRSGTSVGANMEEAASAQSRADLISKCSIACKEARESLYWLRLIHCTCPSPPDEMEQIMGECDEIVAILTSCIVKLKTKQAP